MSDLSGPLNPGRLADDLGSGDPERLAGALRTLDAAWRRRQFVPVPFFPGADCLDAFGGEVPGDVLDSYLSVLAHYPDFDPTPSGRQVRRAMLDAVIGHGGEEHALHAARTLRLDEFPAPAAADALGYLGDRGLHAPRETAAARQLLDHLLDSGATRRSTVDAMRNWAMAGLFEELIDAVRNRLDDDERARLDVGED